MIDEKVRNKQELGINMEFDKGDRVVVIQGIHLGRTGTLLRKCSVVFADYVRVEFDLRKRERVVKTAMILQSELKKLS